MLRERFVLNLPLLIWTAYTIKKALRGLGIVAIPVAMMGATNAYAQESSRPEYEVKAALLYNFARFIQWPPQAFASPTSPLVLCIGGEEPFGDAFSGRTVRGRELALTPLTRAMNPAACHILFIRKSETSRLSSVLDQIKEAPVLTVGEAKRFAYIGGIVNFVKVENKVRFEINVDAAKRAGLKISARLLKLAIIVKDERPE